MGVVLKAMREYLNFENAISHQLIAHGEGRGREVVADDKN